MSDSRARGPSGPGRPRRAAERPTVPYPVAADDGHVVGAVP